MSRFHKIIGFSALVFSVLLFAPRAALADPHTEGVAKETLQKAATDYSAMDYAGAAARLKKAAQACGTKNCTPQTKAALLRDLGTMEFRSGDKDAAGKSWADALALDQTLTLNPSYDASDVGAAWEDARASAGLPAGAISSKAPPSAAGSPAAGGAHGSGADAGSVGASAPARGAPADVPTGDFEHDPALEQKEDTPLPIHVEYPGRSKLSTVVLKYKGAQMREWARVELTHVEGNGYEGAIPCGDVTRGTMRYWIQGFDKSGDPVAATGDPKHPFSVVVRDKIASEPPHLPGKEPPHSCEETDCPPGLPGCRKKGEAGAGEAAPGEAGAENAGATEEDDSKSKKKHGPPYSRLWFGLSVSVDFISLPAARNVCQRDSTGSAVNSQGYYCYDPVAGADFPRDPTANATLQPNGAGTATSGVQAGDIRAMIAFDYALSPSFLLGARVGYVLNAYPGKSAVSQGHAFFAPLHFEARGTYLFGNAPLARTGFSPMGFLGVGASEFDGHQSTAVRIAGRASQQTVDVWLTDAPFFATLGAGVRYQFSLRAALTGAARVNVVIGGNGLMPTFGPELGVLYGF